VTNDVAASVQHAIVKALVEKAAVAIRKFRPKNFILAGGVASNHYLRAWLQNESQEQEVEFIVPTHRWCTDNASMIAGLAARVLVEGGKPNTSDPYIAALPHWSILDI
jgi:N6-L-threonylcarbamoyladenine synthase